MMYDLLDILSVLIALPATVTMCMNLKVPIVQMLFNSTRNKKLIEGIIIFISLVQILIPYNQLCIFSFMF